jgi:hypothetical protein
MTSEKQKSNVVELPWQAGTPLLLQRRAPAQTAFVMPMETENSAEPLRLLDRPTSPETARQMMQNIAGFFSQIAAWDAQQARERRAA